MYLCRWALGASGLALHYKREPYIRRNKYILSGVIMTLELVAQVGRYVDRFYLGKYVSLLKKDMVPSLTFTREAEARHVPLMAGKPLHI